MIKEEYTEGNPFHLVLNNEDIEFAKIGRFQARSFLNTPICLYNQALALPWASHMIQFNLLPSNYNLDVLNNMFYTSRHFIKPFKILREPYSFKSPSSPSDHFQTKTEEESPDDKPIQINTRSKRTHVSACKNYIALLCLGISRTLLASDSESQIISYVLSLLDQKKKKFRSLENQNNDKLIESLRKYIYKTMCGKKIKKSRRKKDFKIRNSEELENLLKVKQTDNESVCLMKEVLREAIGYFFDSECYCKWLSTCMMSETNRNFFVVNKEEIQKKFMRPTTYKPHFSHFKDGEQ